MKPFQRYAAFILSTASLASPVAAAFARAAAADPSPAVAADNGPSGATLAAATQVAAGGARFRDGSYTGPAADAYYGLVQVQANVQGGQLISVDVLQYPSDRRTSRAINRQALPLLQQEVIRAQTTRVDIISGATLTSNAYLRSLNSALRQSKS